jgi:hypothetical protein
MSDKMCNIHDYLEAIGAEPPPIDEKALAEAKANMIMCDSIEEVVDTLQLLDAADDALAKLKP